MTDPTTEIPKWAMDAVKTIHNEFRMLLTPNSLKVMSAIIAAAAPDEGAILTALRRSTDLMRQIVERDTLADDDTIFDCLSDNRKLLAEHGGQP